MMNQRNDDIDYNGDSAAYRRGRIGATRGSCAWAALRDQLQTPEARTVYQNDFRHRFAELLGNLEQWERPPLEAQESDAVRCDGYRRQTVTFTSRPGLRAMGYFLVPDGATEPLPTVLCLPGHGVGVDGMVGLAPEEYTDNFALRFVREGYAVFALEMIGFGRRRDAAARAQSANASSCVRDSMAALMLGETMPGWRVWDAMSAIDYLHTQTEVVDTHRLGVAGISGGGLVALFTAALDRRISACGVAGYFNTFADSVLAIDHCVDNFVPGLLTLCEMPDLAALVAPRALFAVSGTTDPIFPLNGFQRAVAAAEEVYAAFGVPEQFASEVFEGGHRFHGEGMFRFLRERWRFAGNRV